MPIRSRFCFFLSCFFHCYSKKSRGKPPYLRKTLLLRSEIYQPSNSFLLCFNSPPFAQFFNFLSASDQTLHIPLNIVWFLTSSLPSLYINSKEFSKSNFHHIKERKPNFFVTSLFVLSFPSSSTLESISLDLHLSYFNSLSLRLFFRICLLSVLVVACLVSFIYLS